MNAHAAVYLVFLIFEACAILFLALYSTLRLRANFRLFVGGMFAFLLTDAIELLVLHVVSDNKNLEDVYNRYRILFTIGIFLLQGIFLAFASSACVKFLAAKRSASFRDYFITASGAVTLNMLLTATRYHIPIMKYLNGGYSGTSDGAPGSAGQSMEELSRLPVFRNVLILLGSLFMLVIVFSICLFAAGSGSGKSARKTWLAAGAYFIVQTAYALLNAYVSVWAAVPAAAVLAFLFIFFMHREYRFEG